MGEAKTINAATYMTQLIAGELHTIEASIATGAIYVVTLNDRRRVHHYSCPTLRSQLDRASIWSDYGDAESQMYELEHSGGPKTPTFCTIDEVRALASYVSCKTCCPDLDHTAVAPARRSATIDTLAQQHLSRTFEDAGGTRWVLERIERVITAEGVTTKLYAGGQLVVITPGESIYLMPKTTV